MSHYGKIGWLAKEVATMLGIQNAITKQFDKLQREWDIKKEVLS